MITPTHILTVASLAWVGSLIETVIISRLLICVLVMLCYHSFPCQEWTGVLHSDPWCIKLSINFFSRIWCIIVSLFTLLHLSVRPEMKTWSCATLLASVGIALADDLFHMYVWLEVITFAFLGFASGKETLKQYWCIHIFAAFLVLLGTVMIYQASGTLTIPDALLSVKENDFYTDTITLCRAQDDEFYRIAKNIWTLGWLIKSGVISTWIIDGYDNIHPRDIFYVGAIFTKIGLLSILKCGFLDLSSIACIGVFNIFYGVYLALLQHDPRKVLCAHIISQVGVILIGLVYAPYFGFIYLIHHMLSKGLLLECLQNDEYQNESISQSPVCDFIRYLGIISLAGLPPSMSFFIKFAISRDAGLFGVAVICSSLLTVFSLRKFFFKSFNNVSIVSIALSCAIMIFNVVMFMVIDEY